MKLCDQGGEPRGRKKDEGRGGGGEDGIYSELSSQLPMLLEERKAYDGGRDVRGANDLKVR